MNKAQTQDPFINEEALPERVPLGQFVFDKLKEAIVQGKVTPGDRLIEHRIALSLNISRTPVREAMHKLEREGLLQKLPKGGFTVLHLSKDDIEETFGIRSILESYAARLATLKHREEDLQPLEEKIEEFQLYLDRGELEALPRINTEFHNILYVLSGNPKLIKMINDLRDQIYRYRTIILKIGEMARISNEDHRGMLRAIRNKDADRVEAIVREHILRGQGVVLRKLEEDNEMS